MYGMAVSCFLLLNINLNSFQCPGVNDKLNVGHYVLTISCSFIVVNPRCKLCFFYLNLRLSCGRYMKNMVRARTKILWCMGTRSTFLMGEPFLLTLLWLNSVSPHYTKLYIQGLLFIHFYRDISCHCLLFLLCVTSIMLFPKPITYTSADMIYVSCTNMWWINLEAVWLSCKCRDFRLTMCLSIMLPLVLAPLISFHCLLLIR
jgi:hypothetical protein